MNDMQKLENRTLAILEKDFEKILFDISQDKALMEFKGHYEKLFQNLKGMHEKEISLARRCEDINDSIVDNGTKIRQVLQYASEDSQQITTLKNELTAARDVLIAQNEKDFESRKKIERLTKLWQQMQQVTRENNELYSENLKRYNELIQMKEAALLERSEVEGKKDTLERELTSIREQIDEENSATLQLSIEGKVEERLLREIDRQKMGNEKRLKEADDEKIKIEDEMKKYMIALEQEKQQNTDAEVIIQAHRLKLDKLDSEIANKIRCLEQVIEHRTDEDSKLVDIKDQTRRIVFEKEEEEVSIKSTSANISILSLKQEQLERARDKAKLEELRLRGDIELEIKRKQTLEENAKQLLKRMNALKSASQSQLSEIGKMKAQLNHSIKKQKDFDRFSQTAASKLADIMMTTEKLTAMELPLKAQHLKVEEDIRTLRKEKEDIQKKLGEDGMKTIGVREHILIKDNELSEFQKRTLEIEIALREKQRLYDNVRNDRNAYSKSLTDTQDSIAEIKRELKVINHQIDQLKEEFEAKERTFVDESRKKKESEKSLHELEKENEALRKTREQRDIDIKTLNNEIGKLKFLKASVDQELRETKGKYKDYISERDLTGTALIQKNDELALIFEKISQQETTLKESTIRTGLLDKEYTALQVILRDLSRELKIKMKKLENMAVYKQRISELQSTILEEKVKVKALSEELENPLNEGRWRKMGGTDQDRYELLATVQLIQKKLIAKTEATIAQDLKLSYQMQTANNIKEIIKHNPGNDEAEKFLTLQRQLKCKNRKMKAIAAELNFYRFKVSSNETKMSVLRSDLDFNKKKLYCEVAITEDY